MALTATDPAVLRVGNCSGFYGDRLSAMREMLEGGQLDVLTGDYLAELTMLILGKDRAKDASTGYAKTFLAQMEQCMGLALDKGVTVVANAGGLNPAGLAQALRALADRLGLAPVIAHVEGDDLTARAAELSLGQPLAANAYLGAFGIARALGAGADIVVTGRVTDASVIVGPAIAHFGWSRDDLDALAGAVVAGHVIECGTQATGGNFAFFTEIADLTRPGFPIAEIHADGSNVITKHVGTGGAVTVDTVLSQLLYEIGDARYAGPDVTTRLDSIRLSAQGPDRVRIEGVRGEAPPPDLKVSLNAVGGFRNEMTMLITGLDVEAKAELTRRQFEAGLTVRPAQLTWRLVRTDQPDAATQEQASARLTVIARDPDERKVGRPFSNAAVEVALAGYPGFTTIAPPGPGHAYGVFSPGYVPQDVPTHTVVLPDGERVVIAPPTTTMLLQPAGMERSEPVEQGAAAEADTETGAETHLDDVVRLPLGRVFGARSGDKGGDANVGVWARSDAAFAWLERELTADLVRELLPETAPHAIRRTVLANLRAVNFVVEGLLGQGVAYNARFDPQAKGLAEWLRSRTVLLPRHLEPATAVHATPEGR